MSAGDGEDASSAIGDGSGVFTSKMLALADGTATTRRPVVAAGAEGLAPACQDAKSECTNYVNGDNTRCMRDVTTSRADAYGKVDKIRQGAALGNTRACVP